MKKIELGFMRHSSLDTKQVESIIDFSMANGINYFETCWFYMDFKCEEIINRALKKYPRDSYNIIGKLPLIGHTIRSMDFHDIYSAQIAQVNGGYFDIYLLQAVDQRSLYDIYSQGILPFLIQEKEAGRIKQLGISIQCTPEVFKTYLQMECWDIVQMPLNIYDWYFCRYDENYALATKYNLPVIAQAPLKGGLLKGNPKVAYDFINQLDNVELVLCGNTRVESLENTITILSEPISEDTDIKAKEIISKYIPANKTHCIGCGLCDSACKKHIPISNFLQLYDMSLTDKTAFNYLNMLKKSYEEPNRECCKCNECIDICPLRLPIPNLLYNQVFQMRT